jgi:hypothetical protein
VIVSVFNFLSVQIRIFPCCIVKVNLPKRLKVMLAAGVLILSTFLLVLQHDLVLSIKMRLFCRQEMSYNFLYDLAHHTCIMYYYASETLQTKNTLTLSVHSRMDRV